MELTALKTEIAKAEYDGKSDAEIAALVNAKTVQRSRIVETWEVKKHAIENGYWPVIVMACSHENLQVAGLAISARDWIDDPSGKITQIDWTLPSAQVLLGGMVQATLLTQQQADQLAAMATETVSWLVANGLPAEIGPGLVHSARIS